MVLLPAVALALAAVLYSLSQEHVYQARAQVLLSSEDPVERVLPSRAERQNADELDRNSASQAEVAESPALVRKVLRRAGARADGVAGLLDDTEVEAQPGSDLLTFTVEDESRARARALANIYAAEYIRFRKREWDASVAAALSQVDARLAELAEQPPDSPLVAELNEARRRLETVAALRRTGASLVEGAREAEQVQPRPVRNGLIGLAVGLALGIALAFTRNLLDRRVRSAEAVAAALDLPLFARLPGRGRRRSSELPLVHEPEGPRADAYRTLMYRLEIANRGRRAQVIMVTSAVQEEGKTTTAANLALAFARAGERCALVELDLWRPALSRLLGMDSPVGLSDILLERTTLGHVLVRADLAGAEPGEGGGNGAGPLAGALHVLPAGAVPAHPSDLIGLPALTDVIAALRVREDVVILDAPPLAQGGDGIALAAKADALLIVSRLGSVRREALTELRRRLDEIPTPALGVAVTDAERDDLDRWSRYYRAEPAIAPDEAIRVG